MCVRVSQECLQVQAIIHAHDSWHFPGPTHQLMAPGLLHTAVHYALRNHLNEYVAGGAGDHQARTRSGTLDLFAQPGVTTGPSC